MFQTTVAIQRVVGGEAYELFAILSIHGNNFVLIELHHLWFSFCSLTQFLLMNDLLVLSINRTVLVRVSMLPIPYRGLCEVFPSRFRTPVTRICRCCPSYHGWEIEKKAKRHHDSFMNHTRFELHLVSICALAVGVDDVIPDNLSIPHWSRTRYRCASGPILANWIDNSCVSQLERQISCYAYMYALRTERLDPLETTPIPLAVSMISSRLLSLLSRQNAPLIAQPSKVYVTDTL